MNKTIHKLFGVSEGLSPVCNRNIGQSHYRTPPQQTTVYDQRCDVNLNA